MRRPRLQISVSVRNAVRASADEFVSVRIKERDFAKGGNVAVPSGEHMFFPPCAQSAPDTAPLVRTRAPHGARANRGRTREASSAVRTKLSAWRPLFRNGCETGSWAIPGRRSKRMPNVAAARGRPAANRSLYLWKSTSD